MTCTMENKNIQERITGLEQEIVQLPKGSISKKTIGGKDYYYHRISLNGERKEEYIPADEVETLRKKIEQRKALEVELKQLKKIVPTQKSNVAQHKFITNVQTGQSLYAYASSVRNYKKRQCYDILHSYVYGDMRDKVFILYGLRRTGKTTLIRQILLNMTDADLKKAAFIQITPQDTLADLNKDMKYLESQGYRYVFIDEVTLLDDFIEGAALFPDIFAACGMKIVLSGTDSLGFIFSEDEQLYDRCIMLHTTFIPYREFEQVLGIKGIDEYIKYGGTMSLSRVNYNRSIFANSKSTDEYVDTAIAKNIQHSLRCYQHEGHFRSLQKLYEKNELTSAINRVVEDINHRFTLDVLTRDFKSGDLAISAKNLRSDRNSPTDILDRIDIASVTDSLRKLLEIRNKDEQSVEIDDACIAQIKEYLYLLDLIVDIDIVSLPDVNDITARTVVTQPGLRYAQATALITSLLEDKTFASLSLVERTAVQNRILSEIMGRMTEDIVLLETKLSRRDMQVFKLQFAVGEFDMVIFDRTNLCCQIFEIKHSTEVNPAQYRHLTDEEKCRQTEHRYGQITKKAVLYRGTSHMEGDIEYINIEEYLCSIK